MQWFARFRDRYIWVFLVYVVVSTAGMAMVWLARDPASATFWRTVVWVEVPLFLVWLPFLYWSNPLLAPVSPRQAAILPSVMLLVFAYLIVTACTLLFNLFVHNLGRTGVCIHLIAAAGAVVLGLPLQLALNKAGTEAIDAASGKRGQEASGSLPVLLAERLRVAESMIPPDMAVLARAYALLRDDLVNRFPSSIATHPDFPALIQRISAELDLPPPATLRDAQSRAAAIYALRADIGALTVACRR